MLPLLTGTIAQTHAPYGAAGLPSHEVERLLITKGPGRPPRPPPARAPVPVSERQLPGPPLPGLPGREDERPHAPEYKNRLAGDFSSLI